MTTSPALIVGMVHTTPSSAETFDALVHDQEPDATVLHIVDASLLDGTRVDGARVDGARLDGARLDGARLDGTRLDGARPEGVDAVARSRVVTHAGYLAAAGADAVLLTCSSIGEVAARATQRTGVPVLRVDGPTAVHAEAGVRALLETVGRAGVP